MSWEWGYNVARVSQVTWLYHSLSQDCLLSPSVDAGFDAHDIPYDVLWLDIEHTNGKRFSSVTVCCEVFSLVPRPTYWVLLRVWEWDYAVSNVGVTRSIVLCYPDTSLGTQPSFQTQLAWSITWLLREERYGVSSSWNIVHQWPSHLTVTDCVVFQMVTIIDPHIKRDSGYHIHQVGVLPSLPV